ncbi:creatininase family protein [Mesorhizobium sp. Cs1299R1N3]|uniref:creatininase family protein n=1 Tax=Mesorhizobium sp. Cs1299R1N3 TaxID=3015173 RepID=UPI00301BA04B
MPSSKNEVTNSVYVWEEQNRSSLKALGENALVVVPLGAIEQHGPHLPTGTDIFLAGTAVERATARAAKASARDFVIASFLRIGSSDHHLPFGGTISLPPATMLLVLTDAVKSMKHSGVKRVVLVNGHGGNTGVCHAAAAAISTSTDITIAVLDYWVFGSVGFDTAYVPGHAGRWETSLILASRPMLVRDRAVRQLAADAQTPGAGVYSSAIWSSIDGYTDDAACVSASMGAQIWDHIESGLADRLVELSRIMP